MLFFLLPDTVAVSKIIRDADPAADCRQIYFYGLPE